MSDILSKAAESTSAQPLLQQRRLNTICFSEHELEILGDPKRWLSDLAVDHSIRLLLHKYPPPPSNSAIVFSSLVFAQKNLQDAVQRHTKNSDYGHAKIWLLPIVAKSHWILCAIHPQSRIIHVFDSYGRDNVNCMWPHIAQVIHRLY